MKAPLPLTAALAAFVLAAAVAEDRPPRSFSDVTCDPDGGTGALVRMREGQGRDEFETAAGDAFGLEPAEPETEEPSSGDGGEAEPKAKPKPKPKPKPRPKTFRLKPGKDCKERLDHLGGTLGDRLDIVPDAPGMTPERMEKAFSAPGVWSRLSRTKFESPAALTKLFDNAVNGDKTALGVLLGGGGTASGAAGADASLVRVDGTVVKPDPTGAAVSQFQVRQAPPTAPPPPAINPNPNPDSFEQEAPAQSPYRVVQAASNIADTVQQWAADKRYGTVPDNKPFTLAPGEAAGALPEPATIAGGWAELPASGPGYKFVGRGQYGLERVVRGLMASAADPIANVQSGWLGGGGPFSIVAISLKGGGYFPPHVTHRVGIDVDVALWGYHGGPLNSKAADRNLMFAVSVVEHMKPNFILLDRQRQAELEARARFLLSDPTFKGPARDRLAAAFPLLFDPGPPARGRRLFSHVENHRDHFHIESKTGVLGK